MLMGVAQMVGVASILPFLAVLARPEMVETNALARPAQRGARLHRDPLAS